MTIAGLPESGNTVCDMVQCASCGTMQQGMDSNDLPEGWDALNSAEGWSYLCPRCRAIAPMGCVLAMYRPATAEILLSSDGQRTTITVDEARRLAGVINGALRVADLADALAILSHNVGEVSQ